MVVVDERAALHEAVRELAPEISARAQETEALRAVPADLFDRIKRAGLTRLALPVGLGGLEADPFTIIEVIEDLSAADGSTGWTTVISNATAFLAWLEPAVARDLLGGDADVASTSMFGPLGTAVEDGDGQLVLNGRWPFSSGAPGAELIQVGVFVMDGDAPRNRPDGMPDWRFAYLRRDEVQIEDTWYASGLKGTGSHDVVCDGVRIPAERTAMPMFDIAPHEGPLWRLPFFCLVEPLMAGFPLGVARRALDEITQLARTKRRGMSATTMAEDRVVRLALAHAEGGLQAARSFVLDAVDEVWSIATAGERPGLAQERRLGLAFQQAMKAATEAVDTAYRLGGAGAVYDTSPLQRCFRDIHAGAQHIVFSDDNWIEYATYRLNG